MPNVRLFKVSCRPMNVYKRATDRCGKYCGVKQDYNSRGMVNQFSIQKVDLEKKLAYVDLVLLCLA